MVAEMVAEMVITSVAARGPRENEREKSQKNERDWIAFLRDHISYSGAICLPGMNEGRIWRPRIDRLSLRDLARWFSSRGPCASMFGIQVRGGGGGGGTPDYTTNLVSWVKADAGVYSDAGTTAAVNGDHVQQWNDQSSTANNYSQSTLSLRPTYKTNIQNSLPVVESDSTTNQYIQNSFNFAQPRHVFLVLNILSFPGVDNYFCDSAGTSDNCSVHYNNFTHQLQYRAGSSTISDGTLTTATWYIIECLFSGASSFISVNGGTKTTGNPGTVSSLNGFRLFNTASGNYPSGARIQLGEFRAYNANIDGTNSATVRAYLGNKWNITTA